MSVMLEKKNDVIIKARDMGDGQIAEIVEHHFPCFIGKIVHCYYNCLITIGEESGSSFKNMEKFSDDFKVRILKSGEKIIVK